MVEGDQIGDLHPLEVKLLRAFEGSELLDQESLNVKGDLDSAQARRAIEWLLTRGAIEVTREERRGIVSLTDTGSAYAEHKTPELRIYEAALGGASMADLRGRDDMEASDAGSAVGALKRTGLLEILPGGAVKAVPGEGLSEFEAVQALIEEVGRRGRVAAEDLTEAQQGIVSGMHRKRSKSKGIFRVDEEVRRTFRLTAEGGALLEALIAAGATGAEISRLTADHIKDESWRRLGFRRYNIDLPPPRIVVGRRHPYREFLDLVKRELTALGFEEMTGPVVETEFWLMDALYMPQFHSAQDIHDVYAVRDPSVTQSIDEPFFSRVAETHESGGETGSRGWGYRFDRDRARRNVLRSQGTVLSAKWLARGAKVPGKYFALASCFRPDKVDATHSPEFYQIEGIVLGEAITFRTLLGLLKLFAEEVARAPEVKFAPAYFPFTEPSVEVHIKHPEVGWMEMGGAGIFRPEVTIPLGVKAPVIAWGLGLERMAMIALGIQDIRDLRSRDLNFIRQTKANL